MPDKIKEYVTKRRVQAIQVTGENFERIVRWCKRFDAEVGWNNKKTGIVVKESTYGETELHIPLKSYLFRELHTYGFECCTKGNFQKYYKKVK